MNSDGATRGDVEPPDVAPDSDSIRARRCRCDLCQSLARSTSEGRDVEGRPR